MRPASFSVSVLPARIASDITPANIRDGVLRALDRPAREALELARRPLVYTITPATVGLVLTAVATMVATLPSLGSSGLTKEGLLHSADGLSPLLETLAAIVPLTVVMSGYFRMRAASRAILGVFAIGLLLAGIVSASLLSMIFFLIVMAQEVPDVPTLLSFIVPVVALGTILTVFVRVFETIDSSPRAWAMTRVIFVLAGSVFVERTIPHLSLLLRHL